MARNSNHLFCNTQISLRYNGSYDCMTAHASLSKTIVVSHRVFPETLAALAEIGNVYAPNPRQQFAKPQLGKLVKNADAFLAFMPDMIDDSWLLKAPRLRVIAAALKGYDNFDLAACTRR